MTTKAAELARERCQDILDEIGEALFSRALYDAEEGLLRPMLSTVLERCAELEHQVENSCPDCGVRVGQGWGHSENCIAIPATKRVVDVVDRSKDNRIAELEEQCAELEAENVHLRITEREALEKWSDREVRIRELEAENAKLREDFSNVGKLIPLMLETLPWGAYKSALLEDSWLRKAIDAARAQDGAKLKAGK